MKAYRIVEWKERYEVTDKGHIASADTPMKDLRKSPLQYIRFAVHGHSHGAAYRKLVRKGWSLGVMMEMAAFGLFAKLLELAANQNYEFRGWILDEKQRPMDARQIGELLDIHDLNFVQPLLDILANSEIGWLELAEFPGIPQNSPTNGGKKGKLMGEKGGRLWGKKGGASRRKGNERKGKVNEIGTPQLQGEISDFSISSSDSGSAGPPSQAQIKGRRQVALLRICETLRISPDRPSDITTIRDIVDQLEQRIEDGQCNLEIFDAAADVAKECYGPKRIGMFVAAMKQPRFGYVPVRRQLFVKR